MLTMNELIEKDIMELYKIILKEFNNLKEDLDNLEKLNFEVHEIKFLHHRADEIISEGIRKIVPKSEILINRLTNNTIPMKYVENTYKFIRDNYETYKDFIIKINKGYVLYNKKYIKQNTAEIKEFYLNNIKISGNLENDVTSYILRKE